MPGITTDMLHQYFGVFYLETQYLTITGADVGAVYVAINSAESRLHSFETFGHLHAANIASMPYLITATEIMLVFLIPVSMRVADDSNLHRL
jgi:hypothetical protein